MGLILGSRFLYNYVMRESEDYTLEIAALLAQVRPPDWSYRTGDSGVLPWLEWRRGGMDNPMVAVGKDFNQDWVMLLVGRHNRRVSPVYGYQKILESFANPAFRKRWNLNDPTIREEDQHGRRETSVP